MRQSIRESLRNLDEGALASGGRAAPMAGGFVARNRACSRLKAAGSRTRRHARWIQPSMRRHGSAPSPRGTKGVPINSISTVLVVLVLTLCTALFQGVASQVRPGGDTTPHSSLPPSNPQHSYEQEGVALRTGDADGADRLACARVRRVCEL
jgi:hypothetical protein